MNGKSHLIAGTASIVITGITVDAIITKITEINPAMKTIYHGFLDKIYLKEPFIDGIYTMKNSMVLLLAVCLLLFGFILPDMDDEKSMVCTLMRRSVLFKFLPKLTSLFKHHHWTHTIWFIIPEIIAGFFMPVFWYMGFGYFIHLLLDSPSAMGNCFLIPRYIQYPNGAQIKPGHKLKLYHTNETSEYILVTIICMIAILLIAVKLYL